MRRALWLFTSVVATACTPTVLIGTDALTGAPSTSSPGPQCADALPSVRTTTDAVGGECLRWNQRSLTTHANAAGVSSLPGEAVFDAIHAAYATWQTAANDCSDLVFTEGGRLNDPTVGNDGLNVVTFFERLCDGTVSETDPCWSDLTCGNKYHCWQQAPSVVGLTVLTYGRTNGVVLDGDILVNATVHLTTTNSGPACGPNVSGDCVGFDVQSIVTHEIGHFLGLAHSTAEGSTMAPTNDVGALSKRVLDSGTKCFLCTVYPAHKPSAGCTP